MSVVEMMPTPHASEDEIPEDLFATLPDLPSLNGFATRLAEIQASIEQARVEADALRQELQRKASVLREMANALDASL